ncbi:MAG: 3'-5' exonuclease [Cyclobacteriaceae bacterium]|nr:3'-5' exonuclease [Cyclobacteriaceae bacterium]
MNPSPDKILVIDIETIRCASTYDELPKRLQEQWEKKAYTLNQFGHTELTPDELFMERAGIYAEFGKVIVIAVGFFVYQEGEWHFRVRALANHDEKGLLEEFVALLEKFDQSTLFLCGHNGKEFDFPYLSRRMLVNGVTLPAILDLSAKKPWEVNHIDTMELWKFGDRKSFTSLELLATIFDIPSSKSDIDGSEVSQVYYEENDLERIAEYCARDVVVTAQLLRKLKGESIIEENNIHFINN